MEDFELHRLVEQISLEHFGKSFRHRAYFNPKLRTTGGRYLLGTHNIEVNKKYLLLLGEIELIGIIKHELCHYHLHLEGKGYRHRDQDFKLLLKQVDAPRFCGHLPGEAPKKRSSQKILIYECTNCHVHYQRKRRIDTSRYVCGKCRGKLAKIKELRNKDFLSTHSDTLERMNASRSDRKRKKLHFKISLTLILIVIIMVRVDKGNLCKTKISVN